MPNLHEKSSHQSFSDVDVIVSGCELSAWPTQIKTVHDAGQLLSNIVGTLQWSEVHKVIITPLGIFMVCGQFIVQCFSKEKLT